MLNWLIEASLRNRLAVCLLTAALAVAGIYTVQHLPVDAFPDTTPVQVQINTVAESLGPREIEQQLTIPIEQAVAAVSGVANLRSISKSGFSQVVLTFDDRLDIYQARQRVSEMLQAVELPEGVERPVLGPVSSGLGEVFHYVVRSDRADRSLMDLRTIHDALIKPALRQVPGVAEVNAWGGLEKQYHVIPDPDRLIEYGIRLDELGEAIHRNNRSVGGGQITRNGESLLVQGTALATNEQQIASLVVASRDGHPVRVRDVAEVRIDHEIRRGAVTAQGRGEVVLGLGFMLMGWNSAEVTHALKRRLDEVSASLPADVKVEVMYDRTELVDAVLKTVRGNLLSGAILVIALLFMFLGSLRAGLIVALAIPLSMLAAGNLMLQTGISASLLSLGALDFGLIVDSSVIMIENCARRAARASRANWIEVIRDAALEVRRPTMFGELIILIVFLPVLTLEGIEGKMFRPMAWTMIFALGASMVLSLTVMPVLASLLLPRKSGHRDPWLIRLATRLYLPVLNRALANPRAVLAIVLMLLSGAAWIAARLGGEFLPRLGEQALAVSTVRLAGTGLEAAVDLNARLENVLQEEFPHEIARIWTRLGTAEIATDPMGIELSDFFIALRPRAEWKRARTQPELVEAMRAIFERVPGMTAAFSQPIEMRMNELIAGARGDLVLKLYAEDPAVLQDASEKAQSILREIAGAASVAGEQMTGQPLLDLQVDAEAAARRGLSAGEVLDYVQAIGAYPVSRVREGILDRPVIIRLPDLMRRDPVALSKMLIRSADGAWVPLGEVCRFREIEGPSMIQREWGRRRTMVQCDVEGRDLEGFVREARARVSAQMPPGSGVWIEWGGQFEQLARARTRLSVVVPLSIGLVLLLLYASLRSVRETLLVATGIPLGAIGGILALWIRDMPFTVSAAIGFIALSGIAMLNGLVLVTFIQQQRQQGASLDEALRGACRVRLRPVLMTAAVAAVGFIPMALNTGVGGEVQRPLATVVVGGILTSTLLTLIVLPVLYRRFGPPAVREAE